MTSDTCRQDIVHPSHPVLIVDDEPLALQSFEMALRAAGIDNIISMPDSREVLPFLQSHPVEVVILDLWMPHVSGEKILRSLVEDHPSIPIIIVTGVDEVDTAVRCMKAGAFDYMVKPIEKSHLGAVVARAIEIQELRLENVQLRQRVLGKGLEHPEAFAGIVTRNERMLSIFQYVEAIARTMAPVTISGETGVGKELIARALHDVSGLSGPFVPVNAAGVDDEVFSDTLFGHRKGAFTGAGVDRAGLVEQSSGGTLFLDEIGDLSQQSQIKLLRLLQEREYYPVGSDLPRRSSARIVVATNSDTNELQRTGRFRKDLYYRLTTHHVHVPALKERLDDLPLLADRFADEAARLIGKEKPAVTREVLSLLSTYSFPGNVRELRSMIVDAVTSSRSGELPLATFESIVLGCPRASKSNEDPRDAPQITFSDRLPTLGEAEQLVVAEAMLRSRDNQSVAARMLGISRQALNRRLRTKRG